ncbi:MAG: GWxTD domain-containing protein [Gemmatimonadota bacterium]|nr:GWxTD domain-containing protein [Gemmatimonadota bacterium]
MNLRSIRFGPRSGGRPQDVPAARSRAHGLLLAAVLLLVAGPAGRGQEAGERAAGPEPRLETSLIRTWAGDDVTLVDGFVHVPLGILAASTTGSYRFEVAVLDAAGETLYRDSWVREVSGRAAAFVGTDASYLLESFRIGLRPGTYEVELRAYPTDAADLGVRETVALEAFGQPPLASDLVLSTRVEALDEASGEGSWSLERGGFGISAAARTVVLDSDPTLYYYLELYGSETERPVSVEAEIRSATGSSLLRTPGRDVMVPAGGLPFTGRLPLSGLAPGDYEFAMTIRSPDAEPQLRTAGFEVHDAPEPSSTPTGAGSDLVTYFQSLSDEELQDTFGGVGLLVSEAERRTFEALPPDAKRRYLVDFFAARDRTPGPGSSFLDEYLDRIATIRARYDERVGTDTRGPWTTDMGRLYLKFGEPYDRIVNYYPTTGGGASRSGSFAEPPYEIWQYRETGYVYLFIQENQFDAWRLVFTTDNDMTSLADWRARVGTSALQDLATNFGIGPGS